nr:MAG TPA: minor tail protein [Caudoviricetes sp.]
MADNVEIQGLEFQIVNDSTQTEQGLEALRNTLGRLRTACGSTATGLSGTAKSVRELKNALQGLNSGDVQQKITRIAGALNALGQVSNVKISSSVANQLTAISGAIDNLKWTDGDKLTALADGLRPLSELGKSNLTTFINQLGKLPTVIEELEKADIDKFTRQMTDLAAAMKPFADEMQKVSNGFSAFPSRIQRLITSTERYNSTVRRATTHTGLFGKALGGLKFAVVWQMARRVGSMLGTVITESNEYQENMNLFTVAMGEYAESALEYGETVSEVLGIDLSDWIRNQGVFNTLLTGFGDTADRAALMSKNLTQLGYDLSSFFNISVEDSMQKLQSGISGELEPLRRLGYDLSQARLEAVALSLGIDKSVSSMTQAEKAELRYYAIMTQVTTAQGDLARTLEAPANQLRILKAQVEMAGRAIGNIFIPALNAILPYGIAVVQIIREIANAIASLFGFQMTEVDYSGITSAGVGAGELADNLDDAAGAAKKLKQYTAGFDELNVFSPNTASGSGVGAGGGSGFEFALPEYDFLGNAVTTRVGEIKKMLENTLADITVMVSGFSLAVGAILVLTGANIPLGLGLMAAGAVGLAATIGLNWNGMSEQLANTLALITGVVGGFMLALGAIMAFSGANVPLGIALMALGAVSLATAAVVNWHSSDQNITDALTTITGILAGASLAVGAMLALTGVNTPLGIALMAIGAVSIASAVALNWNAMEEAISSPLSRISVIVGTAMLALGAILAFSGGSIPLGIALMALGATSIASAVALNWNGLSDEVINTVALITGALSVAFLAVGAALAFSGANIPLGIALMATGALTMGTAIIPNWNSLSDSVQQKITLISSIVGAALLGVGAILALTGVALPLGLGLMAVGALALGSAAALNWDTVVNAVKKTVSVITGILSRALIVLGTILLLSGAGVGLGLAVLAAGLSLSYAAWTLDDNPITRFVRQMANSIIGLVNGVIDAINDMFHIQFDGLTVMGITLIPAFDIRLVNIPHIPLFEDGGFVDQGQLFIAREAGAEMVGAIGRKTAVANNDQIVEGITAGVTVANDGVIAAIYALLNAVEDKDMSISIGDDVIGRSYDRYNRSRGVRVNNGAFSNAY